MPARGRKSRARRVLGVIGAVVGTTVTFVTATAAAAVVHLDAAPTRRVVATQVTKVLASQFAGEVVVERVGGLGLRGVEGVTVRVKDPTGMQVLFVDGARVRLRALEAARSALFGKGDIVVPVDAVSIEHVDAAIDGDAAGNLRIANAFAARSPAPPAPADPSARGVRVEAPRIGLRHAWIHGQAPGAPPVDAELASLEARVHYDPKLTRADLDHVELVTRGLPRGVDPRGRLQAHLLMPSPTGKDTGLEAGFDGSIAGVPTSAQASMDGQRIDVVVDGRDPSGEGVRATFGEVAVKEEVTLHAEAHGELPRVAGKAHLAFGRGTVDLDGNVDLREGTRAEAVVAVRHVDLHALVPSAPVSDIGLDSRGKVFIARSGEMNGEVALDTLPGRVAGEALPILRAQGAFTKETARATGHIVDPRATADFEVDMNTAGTEQLVEGRLRTTVADFSRLPAVGASMTGHATLEASGRANLGRKTFDARAHVGAGGVAYGVHKVDNATLLATAHGSLDRPVVDVGLHAGGIASGEQKLGVAEVRAIVEPGAVTVIREAHVDTVREGRTISASARRVQVGGARMSVEGGVITGLGEPITADVTRDANQLAVELDAPSIDLARVALLAGHPKAVRSGRLGVHGDVVLRRQGARGEVHLEVEGLSAAQVEGASMKLDAAVDGRALDVNVKAELAEAGTFELATRSLVLGGSPLEPASWKRAHGRAKFSVNVDAAKVAGLVPKESMPFSELSGQLVVAGTVRRDSGSVPPELGIHAHTRGLVVAGKTGLEQLDVEHPKTVSSVQPWRSEGVDVSVDARVDATSGAGELAFHAVDKHGTLVGFNAKADLPYQAMVADPSHAAELLENTPLRAKLVVPKRPLADMPELTGMRSLPGTVEAELDVAGTALEPRVDFIAHARGVRSPSLPAKMAADADVSLAYDGEKAELAAKVSSEKREVLSLASHVEVRARDLLQPTPGQPLAWGGGGHVKLASFALESIGPLSDLRIHGRVSGEAVIEDLHKDAKLRAVVGLEGLRVGRAVYTHGKIEVDARGGKLAASARLDQSDGYADVRAETALAWGEALVPTLDPNATVEARLDARSFRAEAIQPFVRAQVNTLAGRIDADATIKLGPGFTDPAMTGKVVFREGRLQLAALGEQLRDVRGTITFQPGGVIRVDDVFMRGTEGELTAGALVQMRGLALASASANVRIPKHKPLDIAMQGQPMGAVSGDIKLTASSADEGRRMNVTVDVPTLAVNLPQKMKSGVQELSEKEAIRVGTYRDPKTFVKLALDKEDLASSKPEEAAAPATVMEMDVHLGNVTIVQGNMARIILAGDPHIRVANTTEVTGQVQVKEGKIDVQGKKFEIEKGIITFQAEAPENPIVIATAAWTADDGSKIYADFVGPVKTGKVNLRSEPPRPRNEILAMILFGTADGANASPAPAGRAPDGTTRAAVSVGGGFAAEGLTEAVDDLTGVQATARIDTSRSNNPAPEIEIQLARAISIAFQHVLGTPPLSQPDKNLAQVEWRFRRNWSLETTFGDRGLLQTDAVWQKRY